MKDSIAVFCVAVLTANASAVDFGDITAVEINGVDALASGVEFAFESPKWKNGGSWAPPSAPTIQT